MKDRFPGLHTDFIGFVGSILCAIHCVCLPFVLSLTPFMGLHFLENPWMEYTFILISFSVAAYSLVRGLKCHKKPNSLIFALLGVMLIVLAHVFQMEMVEIILTSLGAIGISASHWINWRHTRDATVLNNNVGKLV